MLHCNRGDAIKLQYDARRGPAAHRAHARPVHRTTTAQCGWWSPATTRSYVTCVDVAIKVREDNGKRRMTWWPKFRVDRHRRPSTPDAEMRGDRRALRGAADLEKLSDADLRHHDGGARFLATQPCARARPRSATSSRTRCALGTNADAAVINGGGIRAGKIYEAGSAHQRRATFWPSCRSTTAWW